MTPGTKVTYSDEEVAKDPNLRFLKGQILSDPKLSSRYVKVYWSGFVYEDIVQASKLKVIK